MFEFQTLLIFVLKMLMERVHIDIVDISHNKGQIPGLPSNPRRWTSAEMERLRKSIAETPELIEARGAIVYPYGGKYVVIGGNMRFSAVKSLGWKDMPCIVLPESIPTAKLKEIAIKDNGLFGDWDMDLLANMWDDLPLSDWGADVRWNDAGISGEGSAPSYAGDDEEEEEENGIGDNAFYNSMLKDCIYESDNEFEIPNLLPNRQAGKLELPFAPWGADSRLRKGISTYHFYVEDYRFEAIWKNPVKVLSSGVNAVIEPNLSLYDTTPVSFGLYQIYRKRWISRYFQECGVSLYADLNVARKFYGYNRLGIPEGWDAFATRGYADRMEYLKMEHAIAKEISGKDVPNLIVYGGGKKIRDFCMKNSLVYIEQFMQSKKGDGNG